MEVDVNRVVFSVFSMEKAQRKLNERSPLLAELNLCIPVLDCSSSTGVFHCAHCWCRNDQVEMFRNVIGKALGFVGYTIQYGCIAHCAFEYIGEFVVCSGPSMEPTIVNHDVVFSERMSRHLFKIQKGDIVIAQSPFDPTMNVCKRVIGLEGDKVCTNDSSLFKTHTYSYILARNRNTAPLFSGGTAPFGPYPSFVETCRNTDEKNAEHGQKVPKGHVWLEGDNLRNSSDSRSYGPIPYALIRGRVCLKLWPPDSFGSLADSPTSRIIKADSDSE